MDSDGIPGFYIISQRFFHAELFVVKWNFIFYAASLVTNKYCHPRKTLRLVKYPAILPKAQLKRPGKRRKQLSQKDSRFAQADFLEIDLDFNRAWAHVEILKIEKGI